MQAEQLALTHAGVDGEDEESFKAVAVGGGQELGEVGFGEDFDFEEKSVRKSTFSRHWHRQCKDTEKANSKILRNACTHY